MNEQSGTPLFIMGRHLRNRWGGVYEVLKGLLGALDRIAAADGRRIELLLPEAALELPKLEAIRPVVLARWGTSRLMWDHWTIPAYVNRQGCGVLYNPGIVLPFGLARPAIVSIHDLLYFPHPDLDGQSEYLKADAWYMRRMILRSLRRAAVIHVPSVSTRLEADRLFPWVPADRIQVCPYGVAPSRWASKRGGDGEIRSRLEQMGVSEPYVFYPGGLSYRKNVGMVLDALQSGCAGVESLKVVLTGGQKRTRVEPDLITKIEGLEKQGKVVRLGEVTEEEMRILYQHAHALVYPSLYEGFGLPILEAQSAGCPVISSSSTSLPEVVGNGGLLFEPNAPNELAAHLVCLGDEEERRVLIDLGRANAELFSWDRMALKMIELADQISKVPQA